MDPNSHADETVSDQASDESAAPSTQTELDLPLSDAAPEPPAAAPSGEGETEAMAESATAAPEGGAEAASVDPLTEIADRALRGRLSPADEERAASLLKATLLEGRKGVERAVVELPKLPWIVGVSGVTAAWPEMKTLYHARLIGGLAKIQTDAARRVRLSLSRGLFKQDVPAAVKLAVGVCKEIRDKETSGITAKNAQIFANVLIGRAKPWIAQVPLADLKPADADLLAHCTAVVVFSLPHAPSTQLGVLKWLAERLGKLQPIALETAAKTIGRWNGKWQNAIRKELPELPPEIATVLKTPGEDAAKAERKERQKAEASPEVEEIDPETAEPESSAADEGESVAGVDEADEDDRPAASAEAEPLREPAPPKQRPVYESKTIPSPSRRGPQNFNLNEVLRQIESHVANLRSELQTAQNKLRQRDDDRKTKRPAERQSAVTIPGEPTPEELARLNLQLESRIAELEDRIRELTADSEDRAASMGAPETVESPDAQMRALLTLKLQEDFEDFCALESEAQDVVVQQHYRSVLRHVFEILRAEGVRLTVPEAK